MIQTTFATSRLHAGLYDPTFLSTAEADKLFVFVQTLPRERTPNPLNSGTFLRRTSSGHWNDFGTWRGKVSATKTLPTMDDAPWRVKNLAVRLSLRAGKPVNYLAAIGYEDEKDHIDWHQHGEDRARDARVFIVSLGATRTFGLREICSNCRVCVECNEAACDGHKRECDECRAAKKHKAVCPITNDKQRWTLFEPTHGSLLTLPSDYNWTHEHAVLDDNVPKGLRLSFNTKCLPTDETLEEFIARMERPAARRLTVYDCHAGCVYPSDAVYVGREVRDRRTGIVSWPATPFGNYKKLTGDAFRAYAADKMKDAEFRKQLEAVRGKDLLCWCRPHEVENCHARIWLELANA